MSMPGIFNLLIITPEKVFFRSEVTQLIITTPEGDMGVMVGHMPVITVVPESLIKINRYSFRNCSSLAVKTLPAGVTDIGTYAFSGCVSLTEMTLYEKITNIGASAFSDCNNLKFFTCLAEKPPTLGANLFGKNTSLTIMVPADSFYAYKEADNWKDLADKIIPIN